MKRLLWSCASILIAVNLSFAQDVNGRWTTQMDTPNGPMEMQFTFKTVGDTLTGQVEGPMGSMPIINGKKNGSAFTFDVSFNGMTLNHQCVVEGDSISMKVPGMGGETMSMILRRMGEQK